MCLCMAESDEGVGSLSRRSERSLAWSAEYPPGQRRSLVCEAVPGRIPGRIAMRHPSRTKNLASVQQEGLTQQEYARCFQGLTRSDSGSFFDSFFDSGEKAFRTEQFREDDRVRLKVVLIMSVDHEC